MATAAGRAFFNIDAEFLQPERRMKEAESLARLMNGLHMTDGTGEAVVWHARPSPLGASEIVLLTVTNNLESAREIAQSVHLTGLAGVTGDAIMVLPDPVPEGADPEGTRRCHILVPAKKIDRDILHTIAAGGKIAPLTPPGGYVFH